ncbi:MAG: type B 50S ribosomal protein L31 [Deltaproteobacteria bacterium]|nr:type B 50S ribosomal protein L31 [Deltaproteobacteria bacterium]
MKSDIHPEYRFVVFRDVSVGVEFLTRTTMRTRETTTYEGQEFPLINIDISSASHPFYTGQQKLLDTEGRVERFRRKYGFEPETPSES